MILSSSDTGDTWLGLTLERPEPVVMVSYHAGAPQSRETLRALVERALPPERPGPRRDWRWIGPLFGCAYAATWLLITTRLPDLGIHLRASLTVRDALVAVSFILNTGAGMFWSWWAFRLWFPPLERLPDTAQSGWDRKRGWVQAALGLWITLILGLLALPATK